MGFADQYLEKQNDFKSYITARPLKDLNYIIVIPCYNEDKLIRSLESLYNCSKPEFPVEIIIVINSSITADNKVKEQNTKTLNEANTWISKYSTRKFSYHIIYVPGLSPKYAGAGLARKIGMDEAVSRFNVIQNSKGVIISFDADSLCDSNYVNEIEKHFKNYPDANGCTVYFEHPTSGDEFSDNIYKAITLYELNLRCFIQSLRLASFPFAYHTVGSCFAVRASTYVKQGGMNKRKAGEDFYFLHKIIPLGNFFELNNTRVIPSPRPSARVPFGTGPVINRFLKAEDPVLMTYNPQSFDDLSRFLNIFPALFKKQKSWIEKEMNQLPEPVNVFLHDNDAVYRIDEANNNSNNIKSFMGRLFNWFNAFKIIKFLNFCSNGYYPRTDVVVTANTVVKKLGIRASGNYSGLELLELMRIYEKTHPFPMKYRLYQT
jgi:hypothetical protein